MGGREEKKIDATVGPISNLSLIQTLLPQNHSKAKKKKNNNFQWTVL